MQWIFDPLSDARRYRGTGLQMQVAVPVGGAAGAMPGVCSGDLVAHIDHARPGELTVCALGFAGDLANPEVWQQFDAHASKVALTCKPIAPDVRVVVLAVPPQQKLE